MPPASPPHRADTPFLLSADVVVPMEGDAIYRAAGVVVNGERIAAVGPLSELQREFGELPREHIPGVMLPGLVNAHVHLELGYQHQRIPGPVKFTEWVSLLMQNYPPAAELDAIVAAATRTGIASSLAAGVTSIGDISRCAAVTRKELATGTIRAVSFGEIVGLGKMRGRLEPLLQAAADRKWNSESLTVGISPHAPYTIEGASLAKCVERAAHDQLPLAMHLAELAEEEAFLRNLSGPLGKSWDVMRKADILDDAIPLMPGGPMRWAESWGLLGTNGAAKKLPVVMAHVNYCDDAELAILAKSGASVAYCPRTRTYFGHDAVKPHRYRDMLAAGVNVCLGTDSLASNPDLSVLAEAAWLHQRDKLSAREAIEMITWRGAHALGIATGKLARNTWADIIVLPIAASAGESDESLLSHLLNELSAPRAVWVAGRRMV